MSSYSSNEMLVTINITFGVFVFIKIVLSNAKNSFKNGKRQLYKYIIEKVDILFDIKYIFLNIFIKYLF